MYCFKKEKKEEFLNYRTTSYIVDMLELNYDNVLRILSGNKSCKKAYAYAMLRLLGHSDDDFKEYFEEF